MENMHRLKVYFHYGVAFEGATRHAARCGALKGAETSLGRILMS